MADQKCSKETDAFDFIWKNMFSKQKSHLKFPVKNSFHSHISSEMIRIDLTECTSYVFSCIALPNLNLVYMYFVYDEHMEYYDMLNWLKQKWKWNNMKIRLQFWCSVVMHVNIFVRFVVTEKYVNTQKRRLHLFTALFVIFIMFMLNVLYDFSLVLPQIFLLHIPFLTSIFVNSIVWRRRKKTCGRNKRSN